MYKNKQNHVSKEILIFEGDVYKESVYVDILKSELKKAVSRNEFILDYQPIVTTDKKITKAEALLRWNNPTLGFLLPDRFISYAEETKEIVNIGYWIIAKVCEDLQTLHAENIFIPISINVSPLQLVKDDFVDNVMDILKGYSIECKDLCFEITETVVLDDNETVARNLLRLKEVGIKVALDDFGTGYASFNYLKKYDLDIIKLDEIFIHDNNEEDLKIVKGVNDIAKTFGMDIVIEGVETEGQFNTLSDMGCNLIQGYYFSRPLSLEKFKNLVKENDKLEE
jgi:EAL domain-containing protein (putative c-di-GMP-specific phosphodiesterase class I)